MGTSTDLDKPFMKLLHIDSSIQADASASREITAAIVGRLRDLVPSLEVAYHDLAVDPLPHVTFERFASAEGAAIIEEFLAADIVVLGAPMYNFGLSSQLRAWFDHILVAGKTFRYDAVEGPVGLADGKRVIVAQSRGGLYGNGTPMAGYEHAESHLRGLLGFMGITEPQIIVIEGIAFGPEQREAALRAAHGQVAALTPLSTILAD
jgi:FMN-dependent NADH-azoreductase